MADVLHVSVFYGCDGLAALCERALAAELEEAGDGEGRGGDDLPHDLAPWMLTLAQECGLKQLQHAALCHVSAF
jgi:hypothetical protein